MATSCVDPATVSSLIAEQIPQISDKINYWVTVNSPFANVLDGETFESNQGNQVLSAVTNRVAPGHSLTRPVFTDRGDTCGLAPLQDEIGQTLFTTTIQTLRGRGPNVCVKQSVSTVANSLKSAEIALKQNLTNLMNVDIRAQLHDLSGVKFVAASGYDFEALLSGGMNNVSANYIGILPNAPMTFLALEALTQYMTDVLKLGMYGSGAEAHFRVITSRAQNSEFRRQADVTAIQTALITGSYGEGKDAMTGYAWQDLTYRGVALGIDEEPLRFNCLLANGNPDFIEPIVKVSADAGYNGVVNPDWQTAKYEVGFIMAPNSFTRVVPNSYVGEGSFRFAPQMVPGSLEWFYSRDCNNSYGDVGWHQYEIERAYRAEQPHAVIPFIYKRCRQNLGFESCTEVSNTAVCPEV